MEAASPLSGVVVRETTKSAEDRCWSKAETQRGFEDDQQIGVIPDYLRDIIMTFTYQYHSAKKPDRQSCCTEYVLADDDSTRLCLPREMYLRPRLIAYLTEHEYDYEKHARLLETGVGEGSRAHTAYHCIAVPSDATAPRRRTYCTRS